MLRKIGVMDSFLRGIEVSGFECISLSRVKYFGTEVPPNIDNLHDWWFLEPIKSSQPILKLMVLLYTAAFGTKTDCCRLLNHYCITILL